MFLAKVMLVAGILATTLLTSPNAAAEPLGGSAPPKFDPPKRYYLALGDSVAYGYQQSKVDAGLPPSAFDTGYVDVFAARLRLIRPGLTVVDYGCPQESTASFILGPCPQNARGFPLHDAFSGSQLRAATAFLRRHPGQVSPITLSLGGQDISDFTDSCGGDFTCIENGAPAEIGTMAASFRVILARLRAAAPDAEIIITGAWDGNIGYFAEADPLFQALNTALTAAASSERARFADTFAVFNPQADPTAETNAICALTLLCTEGDGHPSDAGYAAIAGAVFDASGYARLGHRRSRASGKRP